MRTIENYLTKRVDLMVSVSHAAAKYFSKTYNIEEPLVVTNCALKEDMHCDYKEKTTGFEVLNHGRYL